VSSDQWQMIGDSINSLYLLGIFPIAIENQTFILLRIVQSTFISFSAFERKFQKYKEKKNKFKKIYRK
jgi:hypothetical protein